jgi:hypothetical protein
MNDVCCNGGGGGGHRRTQEDCALSTCSPECAELYVPFFQDCQNQFQSQISTMPSMATFYAACQGEDPCESDDDCPSDRFCRALTDSWGPDTPKACHEKGGLGTGCGGMMMPTWESRCLDDYDCVTPMGMMDGGGTCQEECRPGHARDEWGNCADTSCASWFDGCNVCTLNGDAGEYQYWGCYEGLDGQPQDWCYQANQNGPARCLSAPAPAPPPNGGGQDLAQVGPEANPWPINAATQVCGESDLVDESGGTSCFGADDSVNDNWLNAQVRLSTVVRDILIIMMTFILACAGTLLRARGAPVHGRRARRWSRHRLRLRPQPQPGLERRCMPTGALTRPFHRGWSRRS